MCRFLETLSLQLTDFLHTKEPRPRIMNCVGLLAAKSTFTHQQVLHERDQRMYWGHRPGQFIHILHAGPHFRILANEIEGRIPTPDCLYHSWARTVPLDHFTYGLTRMPSKLPKTNGAGSTRNTKCADLHRQCPNTYQYARAPSRGTGGYTHETTSKSSKN